MENNSLVRPTGKFPERVFPIFRLKRSEWILVFHYHDSRI